MEEFTKIKNISLNKLRLLNKNIKRNLEIIEKRSFEDKNKNEELPEFDIFV